MMDNKLSQMDSDSSVPVISSIDTLGYDNLFHIFKFLQPMQLMQVRQVCKTWCSIVNDKSFWKQKFDFDGVYYPKVLDRQKELRTFSTLAQLCDKAPYARNLLRNSNAKEGGGFEHWKIESSSYKTGVIVEEGALGVDKLETVGLTDHYCWAFSYRLDAMSQEVDLMTEGCTKALLATQPPIEVSVWTACRFDCGSRLCVQVSLFSDTRRVLKSFKTERYIARHEQNGRREWVQLKHVFKEYGKGVRYVNFHIEGVDAQFWAGNYGPKVAAPSIILLDE